MSRLIDANALLKDARRNKAIGLCEADIVDVQSLIDAQSTIDAVPVVHGRWLEWWPGLSVIMTGEEMLWQCSVCTAKYAEKENYRYCPNCGAKMDLEVDGE